MTRPVRIGNAHGFWGDRIEAAAEMLAAEPDLDFVTFDFLAEVSMSILALQRSRDPQAGWPRDVLDVVDSLTPYWRGGGRCRMIANAGGLNPLAAAHACRQVLVEAGCGDKTIAVVQGDDVLERLRTAPSDAALFQNLDSGLPLATVQDRLITANAYLGAKPIAEALARGADIVITGRVADPSLTVAACAHFHGWEWDDWERLAGATVAGHLIECGTQVTGGISTDWLDLPDAARIGFPIVEVEHDGSFVVTKPRGTGGRVNLRAVKEQLVYEIGDPSAYLSPDVSVSFLSLALAEQAPDRVWVTCASGRPAPLSYKVSATYQDGYRAQGQLTVYGDRAVEKACRAGQAVLDRLAHSGVTFRDSVAECLGTEACRPGGGDLATAASLRETVLRIAVADESREAVERFTRELMPLITAGPPGTTGYADGRPRVHPIFRYWPCLIERDRVTAEVVSLEDDTELHNGRHPVSIAGPSHSPRTPTKASHVSSLCETLQSQHHTETPASSVPRRLADIAHARSGDKGVHANIGVIANHAANFEALRREVTADRVAAFLGLDDARRVTRYELPNLGALNFVVRGILANGLRVDAQGKTLGQVLLQMPLDDSFVRDRGASS